VRLFAVLLVAACGTDDVDLTGVYHVDADVSAMPCGADQPLPMPSPFLKFVKNDFIGTEYFSMERCSDMAATNCSGGGLFGDSFAEPIDGGWRGILSSASGTTTCLYAYTEMTAKLSNRALVVDSETHSEEAMVDASACTAEEAEKRGKKMPCTEHERIDATRL
jgi:hypothetical protein